MTEIYNSYLSKIPDDFELLLRALGHKTRIWLTLLMLENKELSLSRIAKTINQENSLILNHIKKLELAGIVQNYLKKSEITNEYSFYELTKYGNKIISDLVESYNNYFKTITKNKLNSHNINQDNISEEFELALKSISNKIRYALALLLIDKGPYSFSEITTYLNKEKSIVTKHLRVLETGGILQNYFHKKNDTNEYSFYKITEYGKKIVQGLLTSYNDYYKGITQVKETNFEEEKERDEIRYFEIGCSTWALPNEKILGWIEIFSKEIYNVKMEISENLIFKEFYNIEKAIDVETKEIEFNVSKPPLNYIPFELFSKIPDGDNSINLETIKITAYDKTLTILYKEEFNIEILKPIVKLRVINRDIAPDKGHFEISIAVLKNFQIEIHGLEVKVLDESGNRIEIKEEEKDPLDLDQDLPPEIKVDKLTGVLLINGKGVFYFHFRIPYIDANKTKYYSNVEEVILDLRNIEGNLICDYNFTSQYAII